MIEKKKREQWIFLIYKYEINLRLCVFYMAETNEPMYGHEYYYGERERLY